MSPMLQLLHEMRNRSLAIYVGSTSLMKLADFLRGYDYALEKVGRQRDFLLDDFREWIQRKFEPHYEGWEKLILQQSTDEVDAVRRFWILLDEFLKDRTLGERLDPLPGPAQNAMAVMAERPT